MKTACVNFSDTFHLLDHIAPLAYILDIPFFLNDENNYKILKKYYPFVKSYLKDNLSYDFLANNFDSLISCNYWFIEDKLALENIKNKNIKLIFCPHGNSDKGHINPANIKAFAIQDALLLYGDHMINLLKTLNVFENLKEYRIIGNYRLGFYKKFKEFYDQIADEKIFSKLNSKNKTILYAPTWRDNENSTSFFKILNKLIKTIPPHFNLIIKPHPNIEKTQPVDFYQNFPKSLPSNVFWLDDFPMIYPLLNKCDIYLGDFSSIGYDFLYFQKPMFFLDPFERDHKTNPSLFLYQCGLQIKKNDWDNIFSYIENNQMKDFKNKQNEIYEFAFGKDLKLDSIKQKVLQLL